jgi:hypothetical protein
MTQTRTDLPEGPSPVDITIYKNDDSKIAFYPFGQGVTPPGDFADYEYTIDVWAGTDSDNLILTSTGDNPITTTRDDVSGLITFTLPRSAALSLDWTEAHQYDVRETDPDGVNETLFAGSITLIKRGAV